MSAVFDRRAYETAHRTLLYAISRHAHERLAVVSAFGPGSAVLFHLLHAIRARLPVVFIDTLHHFPETLEHVDRVRRRYDLDLRVVRPAADLREFDARYGERLWERDLELYQQVTKVEPFQRASEGIDACITGRRRDQSPTRTQLAYVEPGRPARFNPLADWTRAQVWRFIHEHELPYNTLHDRGYSSIGDAPLTTPTAPGEHERAGRWRGVDRLECGIHFVQRPQPAGC